MQAIILQSGSRHEKIKMHTYLRKHRSLVDGVHQIPRRKAFTVRKFPQHSERIQSKLAYMTIPHSIKYRAQASPQPLTHRPAQQTSQNRLSSKNGIIEILLSWYCFQCDWLQTPLHSNPNESHHNLDLTFIQNLAAITQRYQSQPKCATHTRTSNDRINHLSKMSA